MLLYYNSDEPLYVIGDGVYTKELIEYLKEETQGSILQISRQEYFKLPDHAQCMIGFHNMKFRISFLEESKNLLRSWPSFVHSRSSVSKSANFGKGVTIGPMTYVGYGTSVGNFCSTGPFVHLGHGAQLGQNCVVNQFSAIGGSTQVGDNVEVGQSSVIRDKIEIGSNIEICMTSAVTKSIAEPGKYFGNRRVPVDADK